MDPYSSPYMTHHNGFHFLFYSFIPSKPKARNTISAANELNSSENGPAGMASATS